MNTKEFITFLREVYYKPRKYSGRGMSGRYCVGIVCRDPTDRKLDIIKSYIEYIDIGDVVKDTLRNNEGASVEDAAESAAENTLDRVSEFIGLLENSSHDSMGRYDMILYWPDIEWPEDVYESEGNEEEDE